MDELRAAADELKTRLAEYAGVYDITDSFREGKREVKLDIKPAAELLGLTLPTWPARCARPSTARRRSASSAAATTCG